jgi:hypothetical protein
MWVLQEAEYVKPELELSLDEHKVSGGSIAHDKAGTTTFAFTIGPLSNATETALEGVAHTHGRICLFCCRQPLVLELLTLERKEARKLRIVGRVVTGAASMSAS